MKKKINVDFNKIRKMLLKIIIILGIIGIVGIVTVAIINVHMYQSVKENILATDETADIDADCIIVLGAGVRSDGQPSWMLEDRILVGVDLYNIGAAPKIIMSGDHGRENYDEVNTMKDYAINSAVPSEDIFMDHAGFETYDSLYRAKEIFGAEKVVIVSQKYHLYRALYIAESLGMEAYGVSADLRNYSNWQYYREAREWLARVKSFGKCIIKSESYYLGETIDLSGSGDVTNDK